MDSFDESLDSILERAQPTYQSMLTVGKPPYGWYWTGESPGAYYGRIRQVLLQIEQLSLAEATTSVAAGQWDLSLSGLIDDARLGTNLGRFKYRNDPPKLTLFESLRYPTLGRDGLYKQALRFETAWKKADLSWVFKPDLTLTDYANRRKAVVNTLEPAHTEAEMDEKHQRAILHSWADELNNVSVEWYGVATSTFAEHTIPGQLIREIPTTYNPSRPPGRLDFTAHMSTAPNSTHLLWRAARGEHFTILAQAPGAIGFEVILDGVTDREWIGLGMKAGLWKFKGFATNAYGIGEESEVVSVTIANALAA